MEITIFGIPMTIDESLLDADVETIRQRVREYERGEQGVFDEIEVAYPDGLTGQVMQVMLEIPLGQTRTYGDVATELDTAAQAVGQACGRNPVPLVVPCHRIVGADSLGGFSSGGDRGRELKRELLELEGAIYSPGEQSTFDAV